MSLQGDPVWAETAACQNTDRCIWAQCCPPGYESNARICVTEHGMISINVGGLVFVKPVEEWHRLAGKTWQLRDRWGWPVVTIKGRPILNFFRRVLHTNWRRTWKQRHDYRPNIRPT